MKASLRLKVTRASTGRQSGWNPDDDYDPVAQVHEFVVALTRFCRLGRLAYIGAPVTKIRRARWGTERLNEEIKRVHFLPLSGELFRCFCSNSTTFSPSFAPPNPQNASRFNEGQRRALYLSRQINVLTTEVKPSAAWPNRWIQRFVVTSGDFKLLALHELDSQLFPGLNHLMLYSERPWVSGPVDPHIATRYLRNLCDRVGADAIEYPTVQGLHDSPSHATNVAVISPRAIDAVLNASTGQAWLG
jgi:hypothetical protein